MKKEIAMRIDVDKHVQVQKQLAKRPATDPRIEALATEVIARVADKWTMVVLDVLSAQGAMRFTQLSKQIAGISQKMLTQTLREMEREGLVTRTVYPVVPPKVQYQLTDLGLGLGEAFCGVWLWAEHNLGAIEQARAAYDQRKAQD